jgi:hypothetical protein
VLGGDAAVVVVEGSVVVVVVDVVVVSGTVVDVVVVGVVDVDVDPSVEEPPQAARAATSSRARERLMPASYPEALKELNGTPNLATSRGRRWTGIPTTVWALPRTASTKTPPYSWRA